MVNVTLELSHEVMNRFPEVAVGGFAVGNLHVAAQCMGDVSKQVRAAREALEAAGLTVQNVAADPRVAGWREAVTRCGLKSGTYKSSVEQLARRFLKGEIIKTPLPVVNMYCAISTQHMAPLGGYDVHRLPEPVVMLRMGRPGTDRFRPLAGKPEDMPTRADIPVYASGDDILCWAFNHRDSGETCLLAGTTTAVFFSEAVTPGQHEVMTAALADLARVLEEHGAWPGIPVIADANVPRATIML